MMPIHEAANTKESCVLMRKKQRERDGEDEFGCANLRCKLQKEYVNNNGTKHGEINITSIILNDFTTTKNEF